ncbi:MAG TPA: riboflavin synthase [Vicinamibacterales bacterium]|nr:riboflavin synthase [Vicinamibacterales bacterium]
MFTGLIEAIGRVDAVRSAATGRRVRIATSLGGQLTPGESIAVNGVCLTVIETDPEGFGADVSPETMRVTTWGTMAPGRIVNLERPLRVDARLGGHFVLGHIDAVGQVVHFGRDGDCHWLTVELPASMLPYVVPKGSIAIDGVSLTIARLSGARVEVQLVPFTVSHTAFGSIQAGEHVNLEGDVLGKYVARLADAAAQAAIGGHA